MATQSLQDRLVFTTDAGDPLLPPECALLVLTSTLSTPTTFLEHHFLHQIMKSSQGAVVLSFLHGEDKLVSNMKKWVFPMTNDRMLMV